MVSIYKIILLNKKAKKAEVKPSNKNILFLIFKKFKNIEIKQPIQKPQQKLQVKTYIFSSEKNNLFIIFLEKQLNLPSNLIKNHTIPKTLQ